MTPCTAGRALLVVAFASCPAVASPRPAAPASPRTTAPEPRPDLAGRVASLVEAFPADKPAARDALCAEILALGPQAVAAVFGRVQAPGQGDDSKARFAANGLVVHAGRSAGAKDRALVLGALADALARTREPTVGTFFLSQLQLLGGRESLRTIARYLPDEALAAPSAAALVAIGGPEAARALLGALDKAPARARLSIVDGLGRLRSREAVKPLLALADGPEPATRQAALAALAASGDPAAGAVLSRSRVDAAHRDRAQAPALFMHYARRLVESGHEAEGLAAARAVLDGYRRPGESQHAAEALALIVSARKEQALPDLLAASQAPERTLRGAALALASRIPGPAATARWVEKASAAAPEPRAEIVAMLGERGDAAALPFVRQSLRGEDKALRLAAAPAAARLGGEAVLPELFERLTTADAEECAVLKRVLLGYPAARVTPRALELVQAAPLPAKAVLIQVLGEKHAREASELIYALAEDAEPATREAALVALASLAVEEDVSRLVALLDKATGSDDAVRLREAITAAVLRSPDAERRADGLLQLLRKAPPAGKVAILRLLPRVGGAGPLRAVAQESASPDPEVQSAAIGALARWPEYQAADELLRIAATAARRDQARSALQGYVRLVARSEQPTHEKIAAFERALALPGGDAGKAVFSAIAAVREPESLRLLGRCLDKPELHDAAAAALVELASRQEPDERWLSGHEAYSLLRRVAGSLSEPAARERAATIIADRLKQGGFVPLFDGRSLDGWQGLVADPPARAKLGRDQLAKAQAAADARVREHWKAVEGVLTFDGKGESLCTAQRLRRLRAARRLEDREGRRQRLLPARRAAGADLGRLRRTRPAPAASTTTRRTSQPLEKADRPVGEWNAFRIVMIGER